MRRKNVYSRRYAPSIYVMNVLYPGITCKELFTSSKFTSFGAVSDKILSESLTMPIDA